MASNPRALPMAPDAQSAVARGEIAALPFAHRKAGDASVDAPDDMVDLYGYTTMAVAALQAQARELAVLKREVAALKRELARRRAR